MVDENVHANVLPSPLPTLQRGALKASDADSVHSKSSSVVRSPVKTGKLSVRDIAKQFQGGSVRPISGVLGLPLPAAGRARAPSASTGIYPFTVGPTAAAATVTAKSKGDSAPHRAVLTQLSSPVTHGPATNRNFVYGTSPGQPFLIPICQFYSPLFLFASI